MKLQRKSLLIRWAFLPEILLCESGKEPEIPTHTTLCTVIGRALFGSVLFTLFFIPLSCVLLPFLFVAYWMGEVIEPAMDKWWKGTTIYAAINDWKNKTCTMVQIVDSPTK